jgi:hypothetical protein
MSTIRASLNRFSCIAALALIGLAGPAAASPAEESCGKLVDLFQPCHQLGLVNSCIQVQRQYHDVIEAKFKDAHFAEKASSMCLLTCEMRKKGMSWYETRNALVSACSELADR